MVLASFARERLRENCASFGAIEVEFSRRFVSAEGAGVSVALGGRRDRRGSVCADLDDKSLVGQSSHAQTNDRLVCRGNRRLRRRLLRGIQRTLVGLRSALRTRAGEACARGFGGCDASHGNSRVSACGQKTSSVTLDVSAFPASLAPGTALSDDDAVLSQLETARRRNGGASHFSFGLEACSGQPSRPTSDVCAKILAGRSVVVCKPSSTSRGPVQDVDPFHESAWFRRHDAI